MDDIHDGLALPDFLRISAEERHAARLRNPPEPMPAFGREITETEQLYRASIAAEKTAKRAADEIRFREMRTKAAAEKAACRSIEQAVKQRTRMR